MSGSLTKQTRAVRDTACGCVSIRTPRPPEGSHAVRGATPGSAASEKAANSLREAVAPEPERRPHRRYVGAHRLPHVRAGRSLPPGSGENDFDPAAVEGGS